MEHSPRQTIFWTIKHTLTNLKEQKSNNVCFSDHKGIKLEIDDRKIIGTYQNVWRLNKTFVLSNTLVKEEISREILKYFN